MFSNLAQSCYSPGLCSQFRSFLSRHPGNHSAFFFLLTLISAEMRFGQHLALITEDLFVQGPGQKRVKKCTDLTVIRPIPFSDWCATVSFPPASFKGLQNPAFGLKAVGYRQQKYMWSWCPSEGRINLMH